MSIDPRYMDVKDWTDQMLPSLLRYGPIPVLLDPAKWKEWGLVVISLPGIASKIPPNPLQFSDWRDWVLSFNKIIF